MRDRSPSKPVDQPEEREPLDTQQPRRLLRMRDVSYQLSMSEAWIYRLIAAGQFPKPIKIGQASRYRQSDVDAWVADRLAERKP